MKKFLSIILMLLAMALLIADSPSLRIYEGNIDDIELYDPEGYPLDVLSDINDSGFVIRTNGETEAFSSPFGDVYLSGDSVLAVTGFTTDDPTLYLMYGKANIVLRGNLPLTIYSPTTRTLLTGSGEYSFSSTDDEEAFRNFSSEPVTTYDALRAREVVVNPLEEMIFATGKTARVSQESYYTNSVLIDQLVYDPVPEKEEAADVAILLPIVIEEEIPTILTYDFQNYPLTMEIYSTYADISYPSFITDDEVKAFFAYESALRSEELKGVTYAFTEDGVRITFPANITGEDARAYSPVLFADFINYLESLNAEEEEVAEPVAAEEEPVIEPIFLSYSYKDYVITMAIYEDYADVTYPSSVTFSDIRAFFAYERELRPTELADATYIFTEDGVRIYFPENITQDDVVRFAPVLFRDLVAYLDALFYVPPVMIPSTPVFNGEPTTILVGEPSQPVLIAPKASLNTPSAPILTSSTHVLEYVPSATTASSLTEEKEAIASFTLLFGTRFSWDWNNSGTNGEPVIFLTPIIKLGRGDWQIGLRAPFQLSVQSGSLRLVGFGGRPIWDFGTNDTNTGVIIYKAIADSMVLIDHLYLGNADTSIAYLRMERDYVRYSTIFTNFKYEDGLSVRLGFNLSNFALGIFVDNAEAPRIGELQLAFYPAKFGGFSININTSMEMLFTDIENYFMVFFPELRFEIPITSHFKLSLFAMGTVYTEIENALVKTNQFFYNFNTDTVLPFLAGGQIELMFSHFKMSLEGGYRKGPLSIEYYNEFTAAENPVRTDFESKDTAFYASASFGLYFKFFSIELGYTVDDIMGFETYEPQDIARVKITGHTNKLFDIYLTVAKRNLVSSIKNYDADEFFTNNDMLFALGLDFDFDGPFGFTAEARTVHIPNGTYTYINAYEYSNETYLQFKVFGRITL